MDEFAVKTVGEALRCFKPVFSFQTKDDPADIIQQAITKDPKITYYLHSYSIYSTHGNYEVKALYINKETDRSDIQIVLSQYECEEMICQYVGKFKEKLIAVAKGIMDLRISMDIFRERHASFYPYLKSTKGMKYHSNPTFSVFEISFEYKLGHTQLAVMERTVDREVERISKMLFVPGLSTVAKIYLAHNYLAVNVEYANDDDKKSDLSYVHSAYGALIVKRCVCQGFAEAFKRLMDAAGIECSVIYGHTDGSTTLHAWNLVSIGKYSSFYHIDVTWDAVGDKPDYTYFCKNDSFFDGKRSWKKEYVPKCTGTFPILALAQNVVKIKKSVLLSGGVDKAVLDC